MSRNEKDTDSSNEGSGTDSEEDQKADDLSSRSESSTASDESESESDATESRFMLMKNNEGGDKRPREEGAPGDGAANNNSNNNKRPKLLGARPPPGKSDSQMKTPPAGRSVGGPKNTLKKPGGKPATEDRPVKKKEPEPTGKKPPQAWSSEDEHTLIMNIFKDMKSGMKPPKRGCRGENYHYWNDLHDSCQGKFIIDWSKDQLYDKYRRMKSRYDLMVEKERTEGVSALKFKNPGEEKVYSLWKQMYEMLEQEEPEAQTGTKPESKRATPQPPAAKSKEEEDAAKKDVPSSSKKTKVIPPRRKPEEPRQNGATASVEEKNNPSMMGAVQELQKKYNAELVEMRGRFEQMMNELQARSCGQEGGGSKPELLNEWLMLSMARNSMPLFNMDVMMAQMLGGLGGALFGLSDAASSPVTAKFKEHWLKQQEDELRVMEQRLRLLQELCQHQQELLKKNH